MRLYTGNRVLRKVNYTYIVTVPKVWIDSVGAKTGDLVSTEINEDGTFVLRFVKRGEH